MAQIHRLPTAADGEEGLEQLTKMFGDANVFRHIRFIRDHMALPDIVGRTAQLAAASMLAHLSETENLGYDDARRALANQLGFNKLTRTNFYRRYLDPGEVLTAGEEPFSYVPAPRRARAMERLPDAADGMDGMRVLIRKFGSEAVFRYIRWMRDHRPQTPLVGRFMEKLAVRMVHAAMDDNDALDYEQARRLVADRLGYHTAGRPWFFQILAAGERHGAADDTRNDIYA